MTHRLEELPPEEGRKLIAELQEVLAKYDAEMSVASSIQLLKRVPVPTEDAAAPVPETPVVSPYNPYDKGNEQGDTKA